MPRAGDCRLLPASAALQGGGGTSWEPWISVNSLCLLWPPDKSSQGLSWEEKSKRGSLMDWWCISALQKYVWNNVVLKKIKAIVHSDVLGSGWPYFQMHTSFSQLDHFQHLGFWGCWDILLRVATALKWSHRHQLICNPPPWCNRLWMEEGVPAARGCGTNPINQIQQSKRTDKAWDLQ